MQLSCFTALYTISPQLATFLFYRTLHDQPATMLTVASHELNVSHMAAQTYLTMAFWRAR